MTRVVAKSGQKDLVVTGAQPGVLYVSGLPVEKNLISGLRRKLATIYRAFEMIHGRKGRIEVRQGSSCRIDLPDESVDYIFTDPPFGGNIPYAEVNFLNEAWLGNCTDRTEEAIISQSQDKGLAEYEGLLTAALSEARRVLKRDGKATLVFHSASAEVWRALQAAYTGAGFGVERAGILDKTQASFKQTTAPGTVRGDPVLLLGKPNGSAPESSIDVWTVAEELRREASVASDPKEGTPERLYSRLIAYYLSRQSHVPIDANAYYRWHAGQSAPEGSTRVGK